MGRVGDAVIQVAERHALGAGGIRGTGELEKRCTSDMKVAFTVHPVSVAQLTAIADAGAIMPPKSTWFEPKLRSGLVVRTL